MCVQQEMSVYDTALRPDCHAEGIFEGNFAQGRAVGNVAVHTVADSIAPASAQSWLSAQSDCADMRHGLLSWMQVDREECPCISLSESCRNFASKA